MGTNFYLHKKHKELYGTYAEKVKQNIEEGDFDSAQKVFDDLKKLDADIHLGKRSAGWRFLIAANDRSYINYSEFKEWILQKVEEGYTIEDEYGDVYSVGQFLKIIEDTMIKNEEDKFKNWDLQSYYDTYPVHNIAGFPINE